MSEEFGPRAQRIGADNAISNGARGLLWMLLCIEEEHMPTQLEAWRMGRFAGGAGEGRDVVKRQWRELVERGYIYPARRQEYGGRWVTRSFRGTDPEAVRRRARAWQHAGPTSARTQQARTVRELKDRALGRTPNPDVDTEGLSSRPSARPAGFPAPRRTSQVRPLRAVGEEPEPEAWNPGLRWEGETPGQRVAGNPLPLTPRRKAAGQGRHRRSPKA